MHSSFLLAQHRDVLRIDLRQRGITGAGGFSDRPRQLGYGRDRTAAIFAELMARLGYARYGVLVEDVRTFFRELRSQAAAGR